MDANEARSIKLRWDMTFSRSSTFKTERCELHIESHLLSACALASDDSIGDTGVDSCAGDIPTVTGKFPTAGLSEYCERLMVRLISLSC